MAPLDQQAVLDQLVSIGQTVDELGQGLSKMEENINDFGGKLGELSGHVEELTKRFGGDANKQTQDPRTPELAQHRGGSNAPEKESEGAANNKPWRAYFTRFSKIYLIKDSEEDGMLDYKEISDDAEFCEKLTELVENGSVFHLEHVLGKTPSAPAKKPTTIKGKIKLVKRTPVLCERGHVLTRVWEDEDGNLITQQDVATRNRKGYDINIKCKEAEELKTIEAYHKESVNVILTRTFPADK